MKSISSIAPTVARSAPVVEEPPERDPIDLYRRAQFVFNWDFEQFAICFGWEPNTIQRWYYGQKPSRQARIMAAILWEKWKLD